MIVFELQNLKNDEVIARLPEVTEDDIKKAMSNHDISVHDIGIFMADTDEIVVECKHERLNEDGICLTCGADKRGIGA
jgi:tRNA nucleotidyltransferase (CCA-adding enzyme)